MGRDKFVSFLILYGGIVICDVLMALGQLLVSITSILVFLGHFSHRVIYYSVYGYMVIALPGYSGGRILQMVLSMTLTSHIVRPFHRLNLPRWRLITKILIGTVSVFHLLDVITAVVFIESGAFRPDHPNSYQFNYIYIIIVFVCRFPGLCFVYFVFCYQYVDVCSAAPAGFRVPFVLMEAIILCLPALTVLITMIIQNVYLRPARSTTEDTTPLTPNTLQSSYLRTCHTIIIISFLYFVCHISYFIILVVSSGDLNYLKPDIKPLHLGPPEFTGLVFGVGEFTVILVNALLNPIVLITRKPDLYRRFKAEIIRSVSRLCAQGRQ